MNPVIAPTANENQWAVAQFAWAAQRAITLDHGANPSQRDLQKFWEEMLTRIMPAGNA